MKEQINVELLREAVERHAFIRHVSKHRRADGTLDVEGNLALWDAGMEPFEKLYLWEGASEDNQKGVDAAYLVFVPTEDEKEQDTILIAHGGGFTLRTGCEGANAAWHFHKMGYNTAILTYRLQPHGRRESMADMQRAIRILRSKKEDFHLSGRVIVMGFSAGAMICGNCATHFDYGNPLSENDVEHFSCRPDAAVIAYGAMSSVSFPMPFGMEPEGELFGKDARERFYLAPEKHVTPETPPMFIWQTLSDDGRHGMCLAKALQDAGVSYELHIVEGGVHGLSIADGENDLAAAVPHIAHWTELCDEWLRLHGGEENNGQN